MNILVLPATCHKTDQSDPILVQYVWETKTKQNYENDQNNTQMLITLEDRVYAVVEGYC